MMEDDAPPMTADPHRQIERLEERIEQLAETIERCRKLVLIAKVAVAIGSLVIIGVLAGVIRFDTALIAALAAVIGGIVVIGANGSTAEQAAAALQSAEAERAELINAIGLHIVGGTQVPAQTVGPSGDGRILP